MLSQTTSAKYAYDPWGRRIWAELQGSFEGYFYGVSGQKLESYSCTLGGDGVIGCHLQGTNTYFAGKMLSEKGVWVATDRLGSVRADSTGRNYAFFPWGEERAQTAHVGRTMFAGYYRDGVGQDYAMARYYNAATGAFWSQDPGSISTADSKNPTSWNRYAFVNGDPINFRDRTGLYVDLDGADDTDYGDDGGCDDFTTKYQASPSPCETFGGGDPPPQRASAPAPPEIDCFAQLKDRPVNDPNAAKFHAVHTFWWVQGDVNGQAVQYIISAGPSKRQSGTQYLNVSVTKGDNNGSGDGSGANTAWSSGLSWINCDQVDALIAAAQNWQSNYNNTIQYNAVGVLGFGGPNSNSAAHYFGTVSGFSPNPPTTAYG